MEFYRLIRNAVSDFFRDDVISLAAALAFFSVLSLAPLIIILVSVSGLMGINTQTHLLEQVGIIAGPGAKSALSVVVNDATTRQITGKISAIAGVLFFLYCSTFAFAQLTKSLNKIWGVGTQIHPIKKLLRESIVSIVMILVLVMLLFLSILAHTVTGMFFSGSAFNWKMIHFIISIFIFTLLFATVFKLLPSVKVAWTDTWIGAFVTAVLIVIGNILIGKYLLRSSIASAYGAAGSLVLLLVWVYYCSMIVFFGAEIMQSNYRRLKPDKLPAK